VARAFLLSLVLASVAVGAGAQSSLRVYRPQHRPAEELAPLARTALGEGGRVSVDPGTNSLVLAGEEAALDEDIALLQRQDRNRRVVRLQYESRDLDELTAAGIHIDWHLGHGRIRVGNTRLPEGRAGARLYRSGDKRSFEGSLRILEGETGTIGRGRQVPVRSRDLFGQATTVFSWAERGFTATPQVLGDGRIQVDIAPIDARVDDRGRTEFTRGATRVLLRPGETVAIGAVARDRDAGTTSGRAISTERGREERILLLTAELEE